MKDENSNYIQVTKDLDEVLEKLAERLYGDWSQFPVPTLEKSREWVVNTIQEILYPAELSGALIRYREPKLQFTKTGPMGNQSYAQPLEKQPYARRRPTTSPEKTPNRLLQQDRMRQANSAWKQLTPNEREIWDNTSISPILNGILLYRGIYISLLVDQQPIPNPLLPTPELLEYYRHRKTH